MRLKLIGPPGTGKTTRLLEYVTAYDKRPEIERILCCSFTVKARMETYERLKKQGLAVNSPNQSDLKTTVSTIHALAFNHMHYKKTYMVNTLRLFSESIGQSSRIWNDKNWMAAKTPLEKSIAYYHNQRCQMLPEHSVIPKGLTLDIVEGFILKFEEWKAENNLLDYNDVLINYLNDGEPLGYTVALVDEAQDLSPLQWAVIKKMTDGCVDVIYAGDDDQTIFNFAGVRARDFIDLEVDETIVLDQTYRFGADILAYSQHYLRRIKYRIPKSFKPADKIGSVRHTNGIVPAIDIFPYASTAILHRNAYLFTKTRDMLDKLGLTYVGKRSPYRLRNPFRAIKYWEQWRSGEKMTVGKIQFIMKFVSPDIEIDRYEGVGRKGIAKPCPYPGLHWFNILELKHRSLYMNVHGKHGLEYLCAEPTIEVTTIHQAKGGEWDKVIIVPDMATATYGEFRGDGDQDAEHRVWYVAVTRAKLALQIVLPYTNKSYPLN